jgi:septal ring factor EnvC (AmiA/AmiB activator)
MVFEVVDVSALALLRRTDERTEHMAEDLHDLKVRLSSVEANLIAMNRRMDRFETRLERIERRPELTDAPTS